MSIIVKGMKMPDNCEECRFETECGFCSAMPDNFCGDTDGFTKPEWCPLIDIPEQPTDTNESDADDYSDLNRGMDNMSEKGYSAEEYRSTLKAVLNMNHEECKKAFGEYGKISEYIKDLSASELIEKYKAYKNTPQVGEYWMEKADKEMVVVRCIENGNVFYYRCLTGFCNCLAVEKFIDIFVKTEFKSKHLKLFLDEMKIAGDKEAMQALACSDTISRQAAKLKVAKVTWEDGETWEDVHDKCVDCLDDVPSE